MLFVLAVLEDISERRRAAEEREHMIEELKEALASVKTYVRDRSEAEFSHDICPECMKKLYGK
jgi:signal transduction histidine kinase